MCVRARIEFDLGSSVLLAVLNAPVGILLAEYFSLVYFFDPVLVFKHLVVGVNKPEGFLVNHIQYAA